MKHIHRQTLVAVLATAATSIFASPAVASTLHGSHASMVHQHEIAVKLDYSFVRTPAQVKALVADSALEAVTPNGDFLLSDVSYPYARPAVRDFIEWLAAEYHAELGSPLVVTSLTRPTSLQPRNASPLSVPPAGMAVDLRIPTSAKARDWLEQKLLSLEQAGIVDVTRERHPPHLHVAVFPQQYATFVAQHASTVAAPAPDSAAKIIAPVRNPVTPTAGATEGVSSAAIAEGSLGLLFLGTLAAAVMRRRAVRTS